MSSLSLINFTPLEVQKKKQFKIPNTEEYGYSLINSIQDHIHYFYIIMYIIYYDLTKNHLLNMFDYKILLTNGNYFEDFIKKIKSTPLEKVYNNIKSKDTLEIYHSIMEIINENIQLKTYNIFKYNQAKLYFNRADALQFSIEYLQPHRYIVSNLTRLRALHSNNLDYLSRYITLINDNIYIQSMKINVSDLENFNYLLTPKKDRSFIQIPKNSLDTYFSNLDNFKKEIKYCNEI